MDKIGEGERWDLEEGGRGRGREREGEEGREGEGGRKGVTLTQPLPDGNPRASSACVSSVL